MSEVRNVESEATIRDSSPGDLVVVGSSAGGIEALSLLVASLPPDFPAPIVLAQHLDPHRTSDLDTILRRRASLPVELVNSVSRLEKGKIYVVPSNRLVTIQDSHVEVQEDRSRLQRSRPSVDMLLSTAAEVYGEHLIAVILTGSGSDGAAGAVDVKNAGGIVIVQDPRTARYPSMPLALPPTAVDFEADIQQIGPLLYDLLMGVSIPRSEEKTEDVLKDILELVSRQASIDFRSYRATTILRRIARRMTVTHNNSMQEYTAYLRSHAEEIGELVKSFLINVTQFFRDPEVFAYLKSEILPVLIAQARERNQVLRLWAAGCASGEEPYSLAMLLDDLLGPELPEWSVKIFATDLDEAAINFARRGLYSENLLKGLPAGYRERFFERADHGYRISKALRQMVIFGQQDLSLSAPFPHIDLVLCRNVLIYFTPELQNYVLNQFAFSLNPKGYLVLGKAETIQPSQAYFELVNKHWKVYRCKDTVVPLHLQSLSNPNTQSLNQQSPGSNRTVRSTGKKLVDQEPVVPALEMGQMRNFNEMLLRFLPTGVIVIDRSYDILSANGTARRLLGLREQSNKQDFLHALRGIPYTTVRSAIDSVFRESSAKTLSEIELDIAAGGNGRFVSLSITLMQMESGMPELAIISVIDVTEQIQIRRQLEAVQVEQSQLMGELSAANKRLNDMNKELLDANEELQVANEELMLTQEELQATIEEFETTNEELQSTNEELETTNEELQATNEELETTNDELTARTAELQDLTTALESERVRLLEMVELAPFHITVLRGPTLVVEAFNPRYARLLGGRVIQGRPLEEVHELLWEDGAALVSLAREVYQQDLTRTTSRMRSHLVEANDEAAESYFVYTLVPTHNAYGKVSGVIIYAADQTQQQAREAEEEREKLKLIFDNADLAVMALYDMQTAALIIGSPRYLDIVARARKLDRNELLGRQWSESAFITPGEEATRVWREVVEDHKSLLLPEVRLKLAPDEREMVWYCKIIPIFDQEHEGHYMLVMAVDITEEAQARQEVERLNRLKDEVLSLASHELRTPLTAILGNVQLLRMSLKQQAAITNEEAQVQSMQQERHNLDAIISQIKRMGRLIDEMLDVARIHSEMFELKIRENVNLVELVRRLVQQLSSVNGPPISFEASEDTILAPCDEDRIEQVLNNLVSNALKYSPAGEPVSVGIGRQSNQAVIWVRDRGQGISEKDQQFIFNRFYRVDSENGSSIEGLGLGLYIAHEIVTRHGGRMWLESKPGEGSTFYFSLPLA